MEEITAAVQSHMDQVADLFEGLSAELRKQWNAGTQGRKFMDPVLAFVHAVDWTEPWLITLIVFHIILLILAITTRKSSNLQMGLFLVALAGVYFAETINYHLSRNWKKFAGQNYFDLHGVFSVKYVVWSSAGYFNNNLDKYSDYIISAYCKVEESRAETSGPYISPKERMSSMKLCKVAFTGIPHTILSSCFYCIILIADKSSLQKEIK